MDMLWVVLALVGLVGLLVVGVWVGTVVAIVRVRHGGPRERRMCRGLGAVCASLGALTFAIYGLEASKAGADKLLPVVLVLGGTGIAALRSGAAAAKA